MFAVRPLKVNPASALWRHPVMPTKWRPPEPLRLHLAARACRSPAAAAKLARAEAYLRDALLAEATVTGRAPPLAGGGTAGPPFAGGRGPPPSFGGGGGGGGR